MNTTKSHPKCLTSLIVTALSVVTLNQALGQTISPVQSKVEPYGLPLVGPVYEAASDDRSATFQKMVLPDVTALLKGTLSESKKVNDASYLLDPSKLTLKTQADVRVYFIGEGAGYQNTLGFNATGVGVSSGDPMLIFPNASSSASTFDPSSKLVRTTSAPLLPGDFSDLGRFSAGTKLDFFLIANGALGGKYVYTTEASSNPDRINHVVSFAYAMKDSPYLIIGFEDLYGGGDRDFNDLLFAVDIGAVNVRALTPEPGTWLTLGSFLGLGVWLRQRRANSATAVKA